jgi:hypothetical protein
MAAIDRFACITVAVTDQDEALQWFTDNCRKTYGELRERSVAFTEEPQPKPFGLQAVFRDLYGNSYALLEPGAARAR